MPQSDNSQASQSRPFHALLIWCSHPCNGKLSNHDDSVLPLSEFNLTDDWGRLAEPDQDVIHSFVDEAGDSTLFNCKGESLIGTNGCSRFFMMGKLDVEAPHELSAKLNALRQELLANPYFAGVPSFDPARGKTAHQFHAKDDVPEVRFEVFKLLVSETKNLRFHAVVCDKEIILKEELAKRERNPKLRYNQDSLYDHLVCKLFAGWHTIADNYHLCVAKRGSKNRNGAITQALEQAEKEFIEAYCMTRSINWNVTISDPVNTVCLQAADYFLWALQRFYEVRTNAVRLIIRMPDCLLQFSSSEYSGGISGGICGGKSHDFTVFQARTLCGSRKQITPKTLEFSRLLA